MAPCQDHHSHAIFVGEDDPSSSIPPAATAGVPSSSDACGEIELLIHSDARSSSSSSSSESSGSWEKTLPAVEIHVHSEAELHSRRLPRRPSLMDMGFHSEHGSEYFDETVSRQQSFHPQLSPSGVSWSPEDGLTRLLRTRPMVKDCANHLENGRLRWNDAVNSDPAISSRFFETCRDAEENLSSCGFANSSIHPDADVSFSPQNRITLKAYLRDFQQDITEKEIQQAILLSASMNRVSLSNEEAEDCASLILEELEEPICSEKYEQGQGSSKRSSYAEGPETWTTISSGASALSKIEVFFRAHWRRFWVVLLWLAVCTGLFSWKFIQYRHRAAFEVMGYCVCTAKGAAETLKLNMALVLIPVCRNTMTWLRRSRHVNSIIPFNDTINFHKLIAGGIVVGIILHGGTHLACDFPRIANADKFVFHRTIADCFQYHQPSYAEIVLSTEGITGISMVVLMAIAFSLATRPSRRHPASLPKSVRRLAGFNTFWYSHHLLVVVYVLLVVHSMFLFLAKETAEKTTWIYIAIPVLIYALERVIRIVRSESYDTGILQANIYPGKVLSLKLQKPPDFEFRSGMYIYVQCPEVSRFEWHPYSLTSAPDDEYLGLHIRSLGDWSFEIYNLFQEALVSGKPNFPKISIDGPYGAASQDHRKYKIVLLIGLGIGATPFVSVLKDIADSVQQDAQEKVQGQDDHATKMKGLKKAYFYWVTREQGSFDWFRDIMMEVSTLNKKKGIIEMHNYLTSVFQEGDKRSALLQAVQALHLMKSGLDIISKTPVQTEFSRPNWCRVFSNLASRHGGENIGVFYCGPVNLGKELERLSHDMTKRTSTRFVFHKEHY